MAESKKAHFSKSPILKIHEGKKPTAKCHIEKVYQHHFGQDYTITSIWSLLQTTWFLHEPTPCCSFMNRSVHYPFMNNRSHCFLGSWMKKANCQMSHWKGLSTSLWPRLHNNFYLEPFANDLIPSWTNIMLSLQEQQEQLKHAQTRCATVRWESKFPS